MQHPVQGRHTLRQGEDVLHPHAVDTGVLERDSRRRMLTHAHRIEPQHLAAPQEAEHLLVAILGGADALERTDADEVDGLCFTALVKECRPRPQAPHGHRIGIGLRQIGAVGAHQTQQIGQTRRSEPFGPARSIVFDDAVKACSLKGLGHDFLLDFLGPDTVRACRECDQSGRTGISDHHPTFGRIFASNGSENRKARSENSESRGPWHDRNPRSRRAPSPEDAHRAPILRDPDRVCNLGEHATREPWPATPPRRKVTSWSG